ncbi:MAG: pilus assembly protein N-terminal domain-containing protein, partial [Candidatus Omnitrophica bacterium]|nr:pilus assembly protein N-terminal domain-containing protein [Candidatus Omnitrophota bacterium]
MNKQIPGCYKTALFFFLSSFLLSLSGYVHADADVNFFKTQSSWADRFRYKGVSVTPGKEGVGFIGDEQDQFQYQGAAARYFRDPDVHDDNKEDLYQPPPPVSILLTTLRDSRETLELEMDQVAELRADGLKRYVATDEDRVDFYEVDSRTLQIKGTKFGNTFIHIWDENGRTTIPLRVIPRQLLQEYADRQLVKSEESQSFTVEYSVTRSTFYTGDNFEELAQTSLSYNQQFVVKGDSPYGHLTGAGSLRRGTDKAELAAATLELADGHIGQFSDFDLTVGDTAVDPALLVLPSYRFRGFHLDYGKSQESGRLNLFFGRELSSIFGTLISTQQTTSDSFMGGFYYDYKPADWIDWRFGYFAASGQDRSDDLNKHGIEIKQKYKISDNLNITSRLGYNEEQIAFDMDVNFQIGRWRGRVSYRDIPENFYSMVGSASGRGEQGVRFNITMPIYDSLSLDYAAHVYRDRLNFFQNEYDRFNVSQTLRGNYQINENSSLSFKVEDNEETALPSQNRNESYEIGYRLRSAVGSHPVNYSVRLRHQDSEPLNSPDAFYRRQSLILGLNTPLWWGFDFAYTYNVSLLEETVARAISHPRVSSYSLTRNERIPETP